MSYYLTNILTSLETVLPVKPQDVKTIISMVLSSGYPRVAGSFTQRSDEQLGGQYTPSSKFDGVYLIDAGVNKHGHMVRTKVHVLDGVIYTDEAAVTKALEEVGFQYSDFF